MTGGVRHGVSAAMPTPPLLGYAGLQAHLPRSLAIAEQWTGRWRFPSGERAHIPTIRSADRLVDHFGGDKS